MAPDWKVTALYRKDRDLWEVKVWVKDDEDRELGRWRLVAYVEQESLAPHIETLARIRSILRTLGTNPNKFMTRALLEAWLSEQSAY